MLPRLGSSALITRWLAITIVASVIAAIDGGWVSSWASLEPARIWRGEVWRLVTWPLIEAGPMALILTCAVIFRFGSALATRWGDQRLGRFVGACVLVAGVVTCLISALSGVYVDRLGGWAVTDALLIAWARQFPDDTVTLYGTIELSGRHLIGVILGTTVLFAIYFGPIAMAPEVVACAVATAYPRWLLTR